VPQAASKDTRDIKDASGVKGEFLVFEVPVVLFVPGFRGLLSFLDRADGPASAAETAGQTPGPSVGGAAREKTEPHGAEGDSQRSLLLESRHGQGAADRACQRTGGDGNPAALLQLGRRRAGRLESGMSLSLLVEVEPALHVSHARD